MFWPPPPWKPDIDRLFGLFAVLAARLHKLEALTTSLQAQLAAALATASAQNGALLFGCPAAVRVGQAVTIVSAGQVDLADRGNAARMPAVGFVGSKPTETSCYLWDHDELSGFLGLVPGRRYWIGLAGAITDVPAASGEVEQQAGFGMTATALKIALGVPPEATIN